MKAKKDLKLKIKKKKAKNAQVEIGGGGGAKRRTLKRPGNLRYLEASVKWEL